MRHVHADSIEEARVQALTIFGDGWSFCIIDVETGQRLSDPTFDEEYEE